MKRTLVIAAMLALSVPLLASALGTPMETLSVDSRSAAPVYSSSDLEMGKVYLLEATGTYVFGGSARLADAECYHEPDWTPERWDVERSDWAPYGVLDLLVDPDQAGDINPEWGECDPTNTYTMCYDGQGRKASFVISDWYHTGNTMMGDNSGSLSLNIYELGCVASWLPPITNADFMLQDGTTLPIKFQLCSPGDLSSEIVVTVSSPDGRMFEFAPLYDELEDHYIVVFHTKGYDPELPEGGYSVSVAMSGCELDSFPFYLAPKASRGNSGK